MKKSKLPLNFNATAFFRLNPDKIMNNKPSVHAPISNVHNLIAGAIKTQKVATGFKKTLWLSGLILVQILIFWLDNRTVKYFNVFAFYIIPIGLATWKLGIGPGLTCSLIATVFGFLNDCTYKPDASLLLLLTTALTRISALSLLAYLGWKSMQMNQLLTQAVLKDNLTGISNRNAFFLSGELELERMHRARQSVSFVFLDLDDFKLINDSKGHETGDKLLRDVSGYIQNRLRKIDIFARLGGDEFALILPFTDSKGALKLMTELHEALGEEFSKKNTPIGFSIGIATFIQPPKSLNYAIKCADSMMYEVKKTTKNSVLQRDFSSMDTNELSSS
jgi:diguanylate cyclase (GGDEF)-like protein